MRVLIRPETKDETGKVFEINELAFGRKNEARLVDLLRKGSSFIPELSLVAVKDDEILGHILFSKISIVDNQSITQSLSLAPMAVLPGYQNQGVGSKLILHGLEKARRLLFDSVIVLGHKEYYPRFGFLPAKKWGIKAPFSISPEFFMATELTPGSLNHVKGVVKYPDAFSDV